MRRIALAFVATASLGATAAAADLTEVQREAIQRAVDDILIGMEVNRRLRSDPQLAGSGLHGQSRNGVVVLRGSDDELPLADHAATLAGEVEGVQSVLVNLEPDMAGGP